MQRKANAVVAIMALAVAGMTAGCRIENDHGDNNNVKIATPFGAMQVKTNEAAAAAGLGLPIYPGAELMKQKDDKDKDQAADVNMSFGSFQLRVKAASYKSTDSADKVAAFYRKALGRYGDVIECQNDRAVGTPTRTSEGLTCDKEHETHISTDDLSASKTELKAGSKQHQHIVGIDPDGSGTKIGIVALDLPGHLSFGDDDKDDDQHKQ